MKITVMSQIVIQAQVEIDIGGVTSATTEIQKLKTNENFILLNLADPKSNPDPSDASDLQKIAAAYILDKVFASAKKELDEIGEVAITQNTGLA